MITFLIGDSGSGKSTFILNRINDDCINHKKSFLLVPEQQTVISEKEVARKLPASAQLFTEVINFTRLANKVFRSYGGLKYNYVTDSCKNIIMYKTVCNIRNQLTEYKILPGKERSYVKLFIETIKELKAYCITGKELDSASAETENHHLKNKLKDISLIYSVYEQSVKENYSDQLDDILMLKEKLDTFDYFNGTNVYIDSFYSFTESQERIVEKIISQSDNVMISFDFPPRENGKQMQFSKMYKAFDKIKKYLIRTNTEYTVQSFNNDYLHKSDSLTYLSDNIWNFTAKPQPSCENINLVTPADEFDECDFVSSRIVSLIMDGCRYSEIAVIMRNPDTYQGIIDSSLEKYNIPFFFSKRTDILAIPLIKLIFSALSILNGYKQENIISFMKNSFSGFSDNEIWEFENYIYKWNLYGKKFLKEDYWSNNPDGYIPEWTDQQKERLSLVLAVKSKLLKILLPLQECFSSSGTAEVCCTAVFDFLVSLECRKAIDDKIRTLSESNSASAKKEAYELSQVWNTVIESLSTIVKVLGKTEITAESFLTVLKYSFDDVSIGTIPTGEDNITIGDASLLRTVDIKHVFVLGVNEGTFPATVSSDGFFSDTEKIELESLGIVLSQVSDTRSDDELLFFKNSISSASDSVTVSAPKSDITGAKKQPSVAFRRIQELFDNVKITDTGESTDFDYIYNEATSNEYFYSLNGEEKKAVKDVFLPDISENKSFSNETSSVSADFSKKIHGKKISVSQSRIETFVKCKFAYYCNYELKLKSQTKIEFSSREIGNLSHAVFETFLRKAKDNKIDFSLLTDKEVEETVDEIIDTYSEKSFGNAVNTNRIGHLLYKIKQNMYIFVKNLAKEFSQSQFSPEFFELPFKEGKNDLPEPISFDIDGNTKITLYGIADRVDIFRKNNTTYVRIVDYKSGNKEFNRQDLKIGLGLQMLIYLFSLCNMKECNFRKELKQQTIDIKPAGVMYYPLKLDSTKSDTEADFGNQNVLSLEQAEIEKNLHKNGLFLNEKDILAAQDKNNSGMFIPKYSPRSNSFISEQEFDNYFNDLKDTMQKIGKEILSGDANASPLIKSGRAPCEYCENYAVCRRKS